jgi:carbamoyl-phosphate synthase large subunit
MKVLMLGAGRRVSLAKRFMNHGFDVHAYETEIECPIAEVGWVIEGKKWTDPDIRQHILETIDDIHPDLVLPLSDHATPILSSIARNGVVCASGRTNTICLDKQKFEQRLCAEEFYPKIQEGSSVIMKPIRGANSKGLHKMSWVDYVLHRDEYAATHVAQRLVDGFEISVDAYFTKHSKMVDAVPRQRLEVQGGEVSRSITLERSTYGVVELTKQVGQDIGLVGPICAQYIVDGDNRAYIMEINARFGGGVILSLEAGFDQVQLLKDEWVDNKVIVLNEHKWQVGLAMTRYFQEHFHGRQE